MRAKLDENMPSEATGVLLAAGWSCHTVQEEGLGGADDALVAAACQTEARVLFTLDLDFADIRAYSPHDFVGIVVLRLPSPSRRLVLQMLTRVLPLLVEHWMEHQLWIVEPDRVRVRGTHKSVN